MPNTTFYQVGEILPDGVTKILSRFGHTYHVVTLCCDHEEDVNHRVLKERVLQGQSATAPVAQGELARYRVTVVNTGPVPLHDVVVEDHFDAGCADLVSSSGPAAQPTLPAGMAGANAGWERHQQIPKSRKRE